MSVFEICSYIAFIFSVGAFFFKNPRHALCGFVGSNSFWGFYYIGLGEFTALAICFNNIVRNAFGAFASDLWMRRVLVASFFFVCVSGFLTYSGWIGLLPVAGALLTIFSCRLRDYPLTFRCMEVICASIWLVYAFLIGSTALILTTALQGSVLIYAIMAYDFKLFARQSLA